MIGFTAAFITLALLLWFAGFALAVWRETRERSIKGVRLASWLRKGLTLGEATQGKRHE